MTDRELCYKVATKVMGWDTNKHGEWIESRLAKPVMSCPVNLTWDDAGRVVKTMQERGFDFQCIKRTTEDWCVWFWDCTEEDPQCVDADTMPRAVFLAALKAVEVHP